MATLVRLLLYGSLMAHKIILDTDPSTDYVMAKPALRIVPSTHSG